MCLPEAEIISQMLKQVQHDNKGLVLVFCHPEPGPELNSGSNDFGISVLGLKNLALKPRPVSGVLYF